MTLSFTKKMITFASQNKKIMPQQNSPTRRQAKKQPSVDNTYAHIQPQALDVERAVLGASAY